MYKAANLTSERTEDGFKYTFYNVVIVEVKGDMLYLNNGGWRTAVTKRHMNHIMEYHSLSGKVVQKRGIWWFEKDGISFSFGDCNYTARSKIC